MQFFSTWPFQTRRNKKFMRRSAFLWSIRSIRWNERVERLRRLDTVILSWDRARTVAPKCLCNGTRSTGFLHESNGGEGRYEKSLPLGVPLGVKLYSLNIYLSPYLSHPNLCGILNSQNIFWNLQQRQICYKKNNRIDMKYFKFFSLIEKHNPRGINVYFVFSFIFTNFQSIIV